MLANVCLRIFLRLAGVLSRPAGPCPEPVESRPELVEACGPSLAFARPRTPHRSTTALLCALTAAFVFQTSITCAAARKSAPFGPEVSYQTKRVLGVKTHIIVADLNNPSIMLDMALPRRGLRTSEPFGSIVSRTRPIAAITGTFFCTRSLIPVGDIVMGGRRVHAGAIGSCLAFTLDNRVRVMPSQKGIKADWTGCVTGLRTGPQLVSNGRVLMNARKEGFRDRGLLVGRRIRAAIGVTSRNKLLLVAVGTPVTLSELAKVMRALGAVDAINLDGGSSTGLSYGRKVLVRPGRRMTNVLVITRRKYQPAARPAAAPVPGVAQQPAPPVVSVSILPSTPRLSVPAGEEDVNAQMPEQHALLPERLAVEG